MLKLGHQVFLGVSRHFQPFCYLVNGLGVNSVNQPIYLPPIYIMKKKNICKASICKLMILSILVFQVSVTFANEPFGGSKSDQINSAITNLASRLENAGGPKKSKPQMLQHGKKKSKVFEDRPFNVDIFVGYAKNYASGDYVEYQKQYAKFGYDKFVATSEVSDFNTVTAGLQLRGFPFMDSEGFITQLSGIFGLGYMRKGFNNNTQIQNNNLDYSDITQLNETIRADYLSTFFMARWGRTIFLEAGFCMDFFIQGSRSQEIIRTTSGAKAFKEPFSTSTTFRYIMTSKTMSTVSVGGIAGIGYQIHPLAGIRVSGTINPYFFKEGPSFSNFQPSIQAFITLN